MAVQPNLYLIAEAYVDQHVFKRWYAIYDVALQTGNRPQVIAASYKVVVVDRPSKDICSGVRSEPTFRGWNTDKRLLFCQACVA